MNYKQELTKAMTWLSLQENTIFLGQAVQYLGTGMTSTLEEIQADKKNELPVFEDTQLGLSTGLAINGFIPISIFPRFNFFLLSINQLVNHLDKIEAISYGQFKPKVIIRTSIGSHNPLWPGHQHVGDFTEAIRSMLTNIDIVKLDSADMIIPSYKNAYYKNKSTILVEVGDMLV